MSLSESKDSKKYESFPEKDILVSLEMRTFIFSE